MASLDKKKHAFVPSFKAFRKNSNRREEHLNWAHGGFGDFGGRGRAPTTVGRRSLELWNPDAIRGGASGITRPASIHHVENGPKHAGRFEVTSNKLRSKASSKSVTPKPLTPKPATPGPVTTKTTTQRPVTPKTVNAKLFNARPSTPKTVTPKKAERGHSHHRVFKPTFSPAKIFSRRARSQSPDNTPRPPFVISSPYNVTRSTGLSPPMFSLNGQTGQSKIPEYSDDLAIHPPLSAKKSVTITPEKRSAEPKVPMPRSTSAFTFGHSMTYVSNTLGSVFKFGHHKNKKSAFVPTPDGNSPHSKVPTTPGHELHRDPNMHEAINGNPQLERFFYGTKISDGQKSNRHPVVNHSPTTNEHVETPTRRNQAYERQRSHRRVAPYQSPAANENRLDPTGRYLVSLPVDENSDRQKSSRRVQAPYVDENGSPARIRRTMYDLGHDKEDNVSTIWENELRNQDHRRSLGLGSIFSDDMGEDYIIEEPKYQFAEKVKPRLIHTSHEANKMLANEQSISHTGLRESARNKYTMRQYDMNISSLRQFPNVNEFAEPPSQKSDEFVERPKPRMRYSPHQRALSRGQILSATGKTNGTWHPNSIVGHPIPLIQVKPASVKSKRNSVEADLAPPSFHKMRRSNSGGIDDDMQAGFELMTGLQGIHGDQHGGSGSASLETSKEDIPSQHNVENREKIESLVVERDPDQGMAARDTEADQAMETDVTEAYQAVASNITEPDQAIAAKIVLSNQSEGTSIAPLIPPRHPDRVIRHVRNRRTEMSYSIPILQMENRRRIPHSWINFSTPYIAQSDEEDEDPSHGSVVPPTVAPQNIPTSLVSSPLPIIQIRAPDTEYAADHDEDELLTGQDFYGIGLAE